MPRSFAACRASRILCLAFAVNLTGCGALSDRSLEEILNPPAGGVLTEETVIAGLREALRIGTERTVAATSAVDGFWGNALIKIAIPEQLQSMAGTLRTLGFREQVDEFELAMNRSAERAAGEATATFWDAITTITIADAFGILNGADTAATAYFRARTTTELRARFGPKVEAKMADVGLYRTYNQLVEYYNAVPLAQEPAVDLDAYITERALDGLFTVLAQEEKRIRDDPAARTTALLRRVFGDQ